MKTATYRIPKGVVELYAEAGLDLKDKTVTTREAETDDEILVLVEDKDPKHRQRLAQSAYDIIVQRQIRTYLESEEGRKLAAEQGVDAVLAEAQKIADEYVYGSRGQTTGVSTANRAKVTATDNVLASIDVTDEAKLKRLRGLIGDAAVESLIAAKRADEAAKAAKEAKAANGAEPAAEPAQA